MARGQNKVFSQPDRDSPAGREQFAGLMMEPDTTDMKQTNTQQSAARWRLHGAGFALLWALTSFAADANKKPNVLFFFADDQRADPIAALGNPSIRTPNLDRLAHSGLAFNHAYMQGAMNAATCVPSRAMLLSGKSLFRI